MKYKIDLQRYPQCWGKVRRVLYRVTSGQCERCGCHVSQRKCTIHHIGAPYANGCPGDSRDKHDIRRENLAMLCDQCHCEIEPFRSVAKKFNKKRKSKRKAHAALHVGSGLVLSHRPYSLIAIMLVCAAIKIRQHSLPVLALPPVVIDSYLVTL